MAERELTWVSRAADAVIERARRHQAKTIICASGISPSGPIHLGNLREVMTTHFICEEIKSRGYDAIHLHSWDDYDRLRNVVAGLEKELSEHIGRPLAAVPDPYGTQDSYASHFITEFTGPLKRMGVQMHEVRQSDQYMRGRYNTSIRLAMDRRDEVFDILEQFQTKGRHGASHLERKARYYPFKPYCPVCNKDCTTTTGYGGEVVSFDCHCGHSGQTRLTDGEPISGKLAWKVDWPMRWAYECVEFEPAGEDHHSPSSSYASGKIIVNKIFGSLAPYSFPYAFVGLAGGSTKMSSSAGGVATPETALNLLEPAILRWLYLRRLPSQPFTIDFSPRAVQRLYDEWDQFRTRAASDSSSPIESRMADMCLRTSTGIVEHTAESVSFRLLASIAELTQANKQQIQRLVQAHVGSTGALPEGAKLLDNLQPRLTCAINYATRLLPASKRTQIRTYFNESAWRRLDEKTQEGVRILDSHLDRVWTVDGLTHLVYAIPKLLQGLPDETPPTPELKRAQRNFFVALYQLLCSSDTGPRLPTLLLSIGPDHSHYLLTGRPMHLSDAAP